MSAAGASSPVYTDAPALHANPLLGSLQLLAWGFCHPSAWRQYIARFDPALRPDFALVDLQRPHWRHPALWRLLLLSYLLRSLFVALPVTLILVGIGSPSENLVFGVALGVAVALATGLTADVVVSVAAGVTGGWVGGVAGGVGYGIAGTTGLTGIFASGMAGVVSLGVATCLGFGTGGSVTSSLSRRQVAPAWGQQLGVVVLGILIGGVVYGTGFAVALGLVGGDVGSMAFGMVAEIEVALAFGVAVGWRTRRWRWGLVCGGGFLGIVLLAVAGAYSLAAGMARGVTYGAALGFLAGVADSMLLCAICVLPYVLASEVVDARAGTVAGVLGSSGFYIMFATWVAQASLWLSVPIGLGCSLAGLSVLWWRPRLMYPWQEAWGLLLYRAEERQAPQRPSLLRWHAAFWDEHQRGRLFGLEEHLVLVAERHPTEGQEALTYVARSRQRWAAQAAAIEIEARHLARCTDVLTMGQAAHRLATGQFVGPASTMLQSFRRISQDVEAALRQGSVYNQRLALRGVEELLEAILRELTRSQEPYAQRFQPILLQWHSQLGAALHDLAAAVSLRQEIESPYILGVPLTMHQEIFVGRTDISARIEHLLADRRHPPLLLYGQRRMGKTSLLNNLGRLLPSTIVPLFVNLQGPAAQASSHAGFLYNLARSMVSAAQRQRQVTFPALTRATLESDPFTCFDEWLDDVEHALGTRTALLALDEFEALDQALDTGPLRASAVLGMLRHLIQHRPRFKVLLAGSHTLEELHRWSSYLLNVQVIHIGYLPTSAARQLIEQPVPDFALRYAPEASQRVLDLTRGHPFLVQLLCAEIVAHKNEQAPALRRLACLADVESAVPDALQHGALFFADMAHHQVDAAGGQLLRFLAAHGERTVVPRQACAECCPSALEPTLQQLLQRELIEPVEDGYRFQVEMIRQWFATPHPP